tara:strand:+ start:158 stop:574 length:417 start_codon:yes stop_codon:yes gene_type:complete
MKKSELKNIIKECVKEVIFEEGVLSGIITEVAQGLQGASLIQESSAPLPPPRHKNTSQQATEAKRRVLSAIGNDSYADVKKKFSDPSLFEGTQPISDSRNTSALSGLAPNNPGIDLNTVPGLENQHNWAAIAAGRRNT